MLRVLRQAEIFWIELNSWQCFNKNKPDTRKYKSQNHDPKQDTKQLLLFVALT